MIDRQRDLQLLSDGDGKLELYLKILDQVLETFKLLFGHFA